MYIFGCQRIKLGQLGWNSSCCWCISLVCENYAPEKCVCVFLRWRANEQILAMCTRVFLYNPIIPFAFSLSLSLSSLAALQFWERCDHDMPPFPTSASVNLNFSTSHCNRRLEKSKETPPEKICHKSLPVTSRRKLSIIYSQTFSSATGCRYTLRYGAAA